MNANRIRSKHAGDATGLFGRQAYVDCVQGCYVDQAMTKQGEWGNSIKACVAMAPGRQQFISGRRQYDLTESRLHANAASISSSGRQFSSASSEIFSRPAFNRLDGQMVNQIEDMRCNALANAFFAGLVWAGAYLVIRNIWPIVASHAAVGTFTFWVGVA